MWIGRYNRFNFRLRIGLQINKRYQKTRPLRTDRSHEVPRNSTRETPLVTLDADHLKPRGPHPLLRIQHRDHTSLHTSGIITYYQNTAPYVQTEATRDPEIPPGRLHLSPWMQITSSHGDHTHFCGYSIWTTLHYTLPASLRTTKTRPLRTERSHEGHRNPTRETPLDPTSSSEQPFSGGKGSR